MRRAIDRGRAAPDNAPTAGTTVRFYADLHVHSKYSRATSRDCDLEHLALWARRKGIAVVGTGDFTHPAWRQEIADKLVPAEPGLFRLRPGLEPTDAPTADCDQPTRFMLTVEISTIYKRDQRTRKVHHLICMPDLEAAQRLVDPLSRIGNLHSDGRPILGLDSRDLLEIVLAASPDALLIPAHIWTPWFSALGSKSGFDSIAECYRDLADHIAAVETGLSSDPPMNWRLSALDRYRLISSSDAHSPQKLGRECCVFECARDYFAMRQALASGADYGGTVEFFPEEGKYHLDGHRACGTRLEPAETRRLDGRCPVCGKPVTVGVLHRVESLADRPDGVSAQGRAPYRSLIPLGEVLAEIEGVGAGSQRVGQLYRRAIDRLGPELLVLEQVALDQVARVASPLLAEALARMRRGQVLREAGYDGEYGAIRLFEPNELATERRGGLLFALDDAVPRARPRRRRAPVAADSPEPEDAAVTEPTSAAGRGQLDPGSPLLAGLDPEQRAAAEHRGGPLLIVAGPGSGKTRTLTHRLAHLVTAGGAALESCLAITFTRRAAAELGERLAQLVPDRAPRIAVHTFHSLGLSLLREQHAAAGLDADLRVADPAAQRRLLIERLGVAPAQAERARERISAYRRDRATAEAEVAPLASDYLRELRAERQVDFDDLLLLPVELLERDSALRERYRERYRHLAIDEYQDIDPLQLRLVQLLAAPGGDVCAIGDPDQAIYGFRGADVTLFDRFADDFPGARTVRLQRSYRHARRLLSAAGQVIAGRPDAAPTIAAQRDCAGRIEIHAAASERAEAEYVVQCLEEMLGGHSFFSLDSGRSDGSAGGELTFGDFAVLYRIEAQADALVEALARSGIPFQRHSHRRLCERPAAQRLLEAALQDPSAGSVSARLAAAVDRLVAAASDPAER
ncbi:MAG: UvrD-helicase domain-containing protein, partial [Deltaproteobacteria bacterium]|nr:UvrD-helicase domain-containing protein [Deltaproteobacteria bacterium]